jgi:hypothetical protein
MVDQKNDLSTLLATITNINIEMYDQKLHQHISLLWFQWYYIFNLQQRWVLQLVLQLQRARVLAPEEVVGSWHCSESTNYCLSILNEGEDMTFLIVKGNKAAG